jgi:vesicular inhibitory amino acid transporter
MDDEQTPQLSHGNEEQQPLLNHDGNEVQHEKISQFEAGYHIICIVAGTGLLQLPYALAHSGWAGLFLIAFLAAVNCYTGIIIIKLLTSTGKTLEGYPQIGEAAFGRIGYYLVSFFYNTAMGGSACLYLVLVGMNFNELFGGLNSQQWTFLVSLMILIPFLSVKTLKEVGFVSLLGVLTSVVVVVIIVIGSSMDFDAYKDKVTHEFFKADSLGSVLGTLCFSYGGNYVFPEVNRSMRDKAQFPKVMIISIGLITMLYMCSGVSGYLTYGNLSLSPILLNLPKGF